MENERMSKTSIMSFTPREVQYQFRNQNPIIKNIERLLLDQSRLQLPQRTHRFSQVLADTYQEMMIHLKLQLRRAQRSRWDCAIQGEIINSIQEKIKSILVRMMKIKEANIYFNGMNKKPGCLQADVEKFMFYIPKADTMKQKLQVFLADQTVSQIILREYQRSFNTNNFVSDIIQFFDFLFKNHLLSMPEEQQCVWVRNSDLLLMQNSNIIFRQICQISDKYTLVEQQLKQAYIHLDFIKATAQPDMGSNRIMVKNESERIQGKMKELTTIAQKIKRHAGNLDSLIASDDTIVLAEEPDLFDAICREFDYQLKERNEHFFAFLEELYEGKQQNQVVSQANFNFIRMKIIKAEMRWHLNRLFSSLNVGSHVISKVHNNITPDPKHYTFNIPSTLIKYELNSKRVSFYSSREANQDQLHLLCKNIEVISKEEGFILHMQRSKVVYPSALHGYYYLLKYLLSLSTILQQKGLYSAQLLLEITSIKADEMMQWGQSAINLYEMIKGKYHGCYQVLKEYMLRIFRVQWIKQLEWVKREIHGNQKAISKLLAFYSDKEKKAGWVNQIIFELDANFDIYEPLTKLAQIQRRHNVTSYCSDHNHFYQLILNQVIQTRNNLKFDRCFSFNSLHQLFSYPNAKPVNLKELAEVLAPISQERMRLQDLLRFYQCQTKVKRQVFKAELYWISIAQNTVKNKFIINTQKKKISFKDFIEQNAKYLLALGQKSLAQVLNSLQQVQRAVLLFSHQVQRLKLIQSSLMLLKPSFPLQDHIAAFNHKELTGFFSYCSTFNFVQDVYMKCERKSNVISLIECSLKEGKLRFSNLNIDNSIIMHKNVLASYIFLVYAFSHHYTNQDCLTLKKKVMDQEQIPEKHLKLQIWRSKKDILKQYEQSQFLDMQSLTQLVKIYEFLILLTLNRALRRPELEEKDKQLLRALRSELPIFYSFRLLEELSSMEKTKEFASISSKSNSLSSLKTIFSIYMEQINKPYNILSQTIELLFLLPEMSIVARRIFCNEMIQIKNEVSGEEWKFFNKQICLKKLKELVDRQFIQQTNKFLIQELSSNEVLSVNSGIAQNFSMLTDLTRREIVNQFDGRYSLEGLDKRQIVLFDEQRGVQIDFREEDCRGSRYKKTIKKNRANFKRGMLNAVKMQNPATASIASSLQQKVNLQIVKQSLPIRKLIYHLQLQQKRIRDEIAWQTCKLQHNVINKINHFIEESNQDQKQSLINFKYTVNLETIKGIQNVIHERTQIFNKKEEMMEEEGGFVTEPKSAEERVVKNQESLLDINVRNVFNHVKKIKIFWAWKNIYLSKQCGSDEWNKFGVNAEKILYNKENLEKIKHLQALRKHCSKQQILCNLIKEENASLNNSIKNVKINNLNSKLKQFKEKHQIDERPINHREDTIEI